MESGSARERTSLEGWRTFDHTADLGLEVWAETPERLYALAAVAVLAQEVEASGGSEEWLRLSLEGDDSRDLMVHWLNSALLEAELRGAVWSSVRVEALSPRTIEATLEGPRRDPTRHQFLREIKAVSHHDFELDLTPGACRCRMVLDL